jgi:hypothetical protein
MRPLEAPEGAQGPHTPKINLYMLPYVEEGQI